MIKQFYVFLMPTMVDSVRVEAKSVVPFNLDSLRRHLSDITEARSVLDNNLHARQRHLEALVFDLTVEMLQRRPKPWNKRTTCRTTLSCLSFFTFRFYSLVPWWHLLFSPQLGFSRMCIPHSTTSEPHWRWSLTGKRFTAVQRTWTLLAQNSSGQSLRLRQS